MADREYPPTTDYGLLLEIETELLESTKKETRNAMLRPFHGYSFLEYPKEEIMAVMESLRHTIRSNRMVSLEERPHETFLIKMLLHLCPILMEALKQKKEGHGHCHGTPGTPGPACHQAAG